MRSMVGPFFLLTLTALAGCATPQQSVSIDRIPFNEAEYAALPRTGTGVVRGQVFATTRGGDVKRGAGREVVLNPVTSMSRQWYSETVLGGKTMSNIADPRYRAAIRTKTADADGRFEFQEVPPGRYYVVSSVSWQAPTQFGMATQGGNVVREVSVENDKTVEVMLTR